MRPAPALAPLSAAPGRLDQPLVADPRARILLVSFSLLFFELLLIRWIPAYVRYLSYFNNFILLAAFLGMGLGILSARRGRLPLPPFAVLLLGLALIVAFNRFDLRVSSTDVLYYGAGEGAAGSENFLVLPLVFVGVAVTFVPLARPLGHLLPSLRPLTAYTFDILGSLSGIAAFFLVAWFSLPPLAWFAIFCVPLLLSLTPRSALLQAPFLAAVLVIAALLQQGVYWSPYYKIKLVPAQPAGYIVDVNNAGGHQAMIPWTAKEPFYRRVYEIFPGHRFEHALILGAGSGSDVSLALAEGVGQIDAVEIDPTILRLGQLFHPDQPYADPRVATYVNDGRAFLRNTSGRYDLVIFALPDSLTLTSTMANLRLESFLLTRDAIADASRLLTDDGLLVLYNYYREDWLVEKLAGMVREVAGTDPYVTSYGGWGRAAVLISGPGLRELDPARRQAYTEFPAAGNSGIGLIGEGIFDRRGPDPATDDWPFIYLRDRTFPGIYLAGLAMVAVVSLLGITLLAPRATLARFDWHMFFLGVAFMLLETRSLVTFSLLFGTTWMVNSLVFFAILSSVLLAILVSARLRVPNAAWVYAVLFGVILVNYLLPPAVLFFDSSILRYGTASLLAFAPIFVANVIFSNAFRDTERADIAFASNLLGIMLGGMLEYLSLLTGYHLLLVAVAVFYGLALVLRPRGRPDLAGVGPGLKHG